MISMISIVSMISLISMISMISIDDLDDIDDNDLYDLDDLGDQIRNMSSNVIFISSIWVPNAPLCSHTDATMFTHRRDSERSKRDATHSKLFSALLTGLAEPEDKRGSPSADPAWLPDKGVVSPATALDEPQACPRAF